MNARRVSAALILAAAVGLAPSARAAYDAFLKFEGGNPGIAGESKDAAHMGWIEVDSFALEPVRNAAPTTGRANAAGRAEIHDIQIVKRLDKASPKIAEAVAKGSHYPEVVIEMRKAGGDATYLKVKLSDVIVSSYKPSGHGPGATESFTLNFSRIEWDYTPQKSSVQRMGNVPATSEKVMVPTATPVPGAATRVGAGAIGVPRVPTATPPAPR